MQQLQHAFQLLQQGQLQQAERICQDVLAKYPSQPDALNLMGLIEKNRGSLERARVLFNKGLKNAPTHLHLLNNAGLIEKDLGNFDRSEAHFIKALKLNTNFFYARQNLASLYQAQRKFTKAKRLYREVIRQQPESVEALANLSSILEKAHQLEEARAFASQALEINPNHLVARLTLADIAARDGDFEEVLRILLPLLRIPQFSPVNRAVIEGKCAFAYEKSGDYQSAFSYFREANQVIYQHHEPVMRKPDMMYSPEAVKRIEETIRDFNFSQASEEIRSPVFLIGFPRSGTTLLDQVLSSHSQITVLEEKPNLFEAFTKYPASEEGLTALKNISEPEVKKLRRYYWANVNRELGTTKPADVIVDKLPLNAVALLHINRIFPSARIITALRDPRDCVFSCYQQRFGMNPAMFQLLDLDTAASYYDQVMRVITGVHDAGVFAMHFVRYEQVVENFASEVNALIEFLGLPWEDTLFDYRAIAKTRDINTPSASQVIQPLYTTSIGKWKHYQDWIGASFDPLAKWVKHWGYPE